MAASGGVIQVDATSVLASGKTQTIEAPGGQTVIVRPLGSGCEVGRSCIIVECAGRRVMLDCGIHPAKKGLDSLPYFGDAADMASIDLCLVTHFHLDHCGALPYLCENTGFEGRVFMTHPTFAFFQMVMADFIKVGSAGAEDVVRSEWVQSTLQRIDKISYRQDVRDAQSGVRFQALNAGHVLGAAMFLIEIAGVRILYTGDFSLEPDRHLFGAERPPVQPDVVIVESTYGILEHESITERERKFKSWVREIVSRGGKCLIPVFALGRAQELLLILEEFWAESPDLQHVPIHYASSFATQSIRQFKMFAATAMNARVKAQVDNHSNPWDFKYITYMRDAKSVKETGPCVVLASPGMLQSGVSLELFERWCGNPINGVIVAGYCVEGTIAYDLVRNNKREIVKEDGRTLAVRMTSIHEVSFSAHSDCPHTTQFIRDLDARHVVLVHGNENSAKNLQKRLQDEFADRDMAVYTPRNREDVVIPLALRRTASVLGRLAHTTATFMEKGHVDGSAEGDAAIEGVLVRSERGRIAVVAAEELQQFTDLPVCRDLRQAVVIPFATFRTAEEILKTLQSFVDSSTWDAQPAVRLEQGSPADAFVPFATALSEAQPFEDAALRTSVFRVAAGVRVTVHEIATRGTTMASVSWRAHHVADVVADTIVLGLLHLDTAARADPAVVAADGGDYLRPTPAEGDRTFRLQCFHRMLSLHFPAVRVNLRTGAAVVFVPHTFGTASREAATAAVARAAALRSGSGAWVEVRDWLDFAPAEGSELTDEAQHHIALTLQRIFLALNPVPFEEDGVLQNAKAHGGLGDLLDGAGWCGCHLHAPTH